MSDQTHQPFLSIKEVTKTFSARRNAVVEKVIALAPLDLAIEEGEFVAIVGPSGCGKSTLLRIIDGLQPADEGEVRIRGEIVTGPGPDRGMVFQHHNLMPWRTVRRNVEYGLENQKLKKESRQSIAMEWLAKVDLDGFADFHPNQLSGGMQQRVGLARALAINPDILLMDEPFGALDAQTRIQLQDELERLWRSARKTVVFVTHDIEEALYLADRVVVMSARPGRIVEDIKVPFPRPRTDELRGDSEFGELKSRIWNLLRSTDDVGSS